jgi:hypothetical protein
MMVLGGDQDLLRERDTETALQGNYGVLYMFPIHIHNPTTKSASLLLEMHASGGQAGGVFRIDDRIVDVPRVPSGSVLPRGSDSGSSRGGPRFVRLDDAGERLELPGAAHARAPAMKHHRAMAAIGCWMYVHRGYAVGRITHRPGSTPSADSVTVYLRDVPWVLEAHAAVVAGSNG